MTNLTPAQITTPCIVCATTARFKGAVLFADRGMDWPVTTVGGHQVHLACLSDANHLILSASDITVIDGVARWNGSGRALFDDSVALLQALGLHEDIDPAATEAARKDETARALDAIRSAPPAEPSAEELAEMRAAFGPGEKVVNVITGRRTQL
jgi:hypothetical protein